MLMKFLELAQRDYEKMADYAAREHSRNHFPMRAAISSAASKWWKYPSALRT
ncbi:MAG: hypothetical protein R3D29_09220 [Nitratireductor sp.]